MGRTDKRTIGMVRVMRIEKTNSLDIESKKSKRLGEIGTAAVTTTPRRQGHICTMGTISWKSLNASKRIS
jgi:hypothetical protein